MMLGAAGVLFAMARRSVCMHDSSLSTTVDINNSSIQENPTCVPLTYDAGDEIIKGFIETFKKIDSDLESLLQQKRRESGEVLYNAAALPKKLENSIEKASSSIADEAPDSSCMENIPSNEFVKEWPQEERIFTSIGEIILSHERNLSSYKQDIDTMKETIQNNLKRLNDSIPANNAE
ncbi:hypothetical protein ENBRE01_2389 [Enteropsectra breve]|nr:hypothetical protein ENBRE01_2389 [Enteropsectra breve]